MQANCSSCKLSIDVCELVETPFVAFKINVAEKQVLHEWV